MRGFIDEHRDAFGVEPICKALQVAPSGYRRYVAQRRNPALRCARARNDEALVPHIERVWRANMQVYGVEKVWRQLAREGHTGPRCRVERPCCQRIGSPPNSSGIRTPLAPLDVRCWMLGVGCFLLSSDSGIQCANVIGECSGAFVCLATCKAPEGWRTPGR